MTRPLDAASPDSDFRAVWVEVDVDEAEELLASNQPEPLLHPVTEWEPPAVRGPMPEDMVPRARLVLERQLAITHLLTQRLASTTQQQRLTRAVRETATPDLPVYLDITA